MLALTVSSFQSQTPSLEGIDFIRANRPLYPVAEKATGNFFSVNFTKRLASEAAELPFQVDVHLARHPLFVAFGEQGGHEAQARSGVWED